MHYRFILADTNATHQLGQSLARLLPANTVILLEGELGAGKTTLVQGIGKALGISEPIVSPTFTLVNEYLEGTLPLYHLDLYRLSPNEVATIYPETYWEGREVPPGITVIEWAQLLPYKPENYLSIQLTHHPSGGREVNLSKVGEIKVELAEISASFRK